MTTLLLVYTMRWIDDTEFALLYDANFSKNLNLPYWKHELFDFNQLTDDECKRNFQLYKNDVYNFIDIFNVPERIECYNRVVVDG